MRIRQRNGNVDIDISDARIRGNLREAQKELNLAVRKDTTPFVPKGGSGDLRRSANFPDGVYGGVLEYNTPYAHYLYVGEKYGPNIPEYDSSGNLIGFWSPPHKYPTGEPLHYHTAGTGDHWFDKAKEQHKDDWIRLVKETAGKG